MGLLDGGLQRVFGSVFAGIMLDGTLHVVTTAPDGRGGYTTTSADTPIKGMVDTYSDAYRIATGIPATDVRLIVLQDGVAAAPTLDAQITLRGTRYKVVSIEQDPAQASWTMRGRPA